VFIEELLPVARERLATIDAAASVKEAADIMSRPHTELVVVCNDAGSMIGVITKSDIVAQISRCGADGCNARVDTIMIREVFSSRASEWLQDAWAIMKARGLQRIPVIDEDGKPIGTLYSRDALQSLLGEAENEEALLRDYVMNVGYQ
jgi:CBS domain-containing protein